MRRVLVACEFSGTVRDAFRAHGWDAWSCDLEPASGKHFQGDVRELLTSHWHLLIAHPPCTYLASSGMHWTSRGLRDPKLTDEAVDFVMQLWNAPITHIAIENPIGVLSTRICKPAQIIQPWQFGHREKKATCLWLKNLPKLVPTHEVDGMNQYKYVMGSSNTMILSMGPSPERAKLRSVTFPGIA